MASDYGYEWQGCGLLLIFPRNATLFIQGEDGAELHDQLEACETDEEVQVLLEEYEGNLPDEYLEDCGR